MNPWPIAPLGAKDLDFAIVNYDFIDLTAGELGPLPSLEAAMDSNLADFATSIADQTVLVDSMAGDLDDLGNVLNELATDDFTQVLGDLAGIGSAGDSLLNDFTSQFAPTSTPAPAPTPAPTPAPPSAGGGGGTSGSSGQPAPPPGQPPRPPGFFPL
jgi:hypothetical protein